MAQLVGSFSLGMLSNIFGLQLARPLDAGGERSRGIVEPSSEAQGTDRTGVRLVVSPSPPNLNFSPIKIIESPMVQRLHITTDSFLSFSIFSDKICVHTQVSQ